MPVGADLVQEVRDLPCSVVTELRAVSESVSDESQVAALIVFVACAVPGWITFRSDLVADVVAIYPRPAARIGAGELVSPLIVRVGRRVPFGVRNREGVAICVI